MAIAHEWNTIAHLQDYEGRPEARPFTRAELQQFLDYADDQVDQAVWAKRKGALAAYRDATLFKVIYAWGLFSGVRPVRWKLGFSRLCSSEAVGRDAVCCDRCGATTWVRRVAWAGLHG